MKKYIPFFITFLIISLSACSPKILFTYDIKQRLDYEGLELEKVQFYNSRKIVLERILPHKGSVVAGGKIRFENGKMIEQVVVKRNTPGICEFRNDNEMDISFENGEGRYLKFKVDKYQDFFQIYTEINKAGYNTVFYDTTVYSD